MNEDIRDGYVGTHRMNDTHQLIVDALWDPRYVGIIPMLGFGILGFIGTALIWWTCH